MDILGLKGHPVFWREQDDNNGSSKKKCRQKNSTFLIPELEICFSFPFRVLLAKTSCFLGENREFIPGRKIDNIDDNINLRMKDQGAELSILKKCSL